MKEKIKVCTVLSLIYLVYFIAITAWITEVEHTIHPDFTAGISLEEWREMINMQNSLEMSSIYLILTILFFVSSYIYNKFKFEINILYVLPVMFTMIDMWIYINGNGPGIYWYKFYGFEIASILLSLLTIFLYDNYRKSK